MDVGNINDSVRFAMGSYSWTEDSWIPTSSYAIGEDV